MFLWSNTEVEEVFLCCSMHGALCRAFYFMFLFSVSLVRPVPMYLIYQVPHISVVPHIYYYYYIALDRFFLLFHAWCIVPCFLFNVLNPASMYLIYQVPHISVVLHIYYYCYIDLDRIFLLFHAGALCHAFCLCSCVLRLCALYVPMYLIYQGPHISVVLHIYYYCCTALDRIFLLFLRPAPAWCIVPCFLFNVPASCTYVPYMCLCTLYTRDPHISVVLHIHYY